MSIRCAVLVTTFCSAAALSGCGHSAAPAPAPEHAQPAAPSCDIVAAHLISFLDPGSAQEFGPKARQLIVRRCEIDSWTAVIRQCFAAARTNEDTGPCSDQLSTAPRRALIKARLGVETIDAPTAPPQPGS
jgi:hypothetical protein